SAREITCMRDRRWLLSFGLALGAVLVAPSPGSAGVLDASWTAPTTNTDGSPLIDLASYRVYYGASAPQCPGGTFVQVPSSTSTPSANQTVTSRLTGLTAGTLYNVSLTAVDSAGRESACSTGASAVAPVDFAVTPTGTGVSTTSTSTLTVASTGAGSGTTSVSSLAVSSTGAGSGTVTSSPAGISCGATCSASFTNGAAVTLTAVPAAGSTFTGWSGGGCPGTGTCTVTVNG